MKVVLPGPDETDAKKGILSLIDRGFIPPGAQLVLEPPPIKQSLVPIYRGQERQKVPLKGWDTFFCLTKATCNNLQLL